MSIFSSINNNNKTFISTTTISFILIITAVSLFFVFAISNQTFAQEGNIYEGLGIKIKYFDPWEISLKEDDPSCQILCSIGFSIPDQDSRTMILIMQDKFDKPEIKNNCKCDTLLEYVKYKYENTISKNQDLVFINDNQTTLIDHNIPAIQMEFENKGNTTIGDSIIDIFTKEPNSFYDILFSVDKNEQYSKYLDDFKKMVNSLEFVSINEIKPKQPSFMVPNGKEEENKKEPLNQPQSTEQQQQFSELALYKDPEGKFTLDYDSSLWIAIPDRNRFDELEVSFADKETGGNDVSVIIGVIKDPTPNLSIKEATELVLPNYIGGNKYEDKQLEEGIECEKMAIQGYDTCSFIFSQPKSYFDTYPRTYFMMVNAKIGDELWIITFTAAGDKFSDFEQNVIQMINSIKITN